MQVLAIADDTTGALEVGAQFAADGVRSLVTVKLRLAGEATALVVDTQTRHANPARARRRVAQIAAMAREAGIPYLYKKTDSTLRGNIAAEFQALLGVFPERLLVYVPAYPKMGRVVAGGELYVDGLPLAKTAFAGDPFNPCREGSIPRLLAAGTKAPVLLAATRKQFEALLQDAVPGSIIVCDGSSDDDLWAAAEAVARAKRPCIVAGTGGFAGPWVSTLTVKRSRLAPNTPIKRCLVLSGSLHPASRGQIQEGAAAGVPTVYLGKDPHPFSALASELATRGWAALATPGNCPPGVSRRIGAIARRVLDRRLVDGLVIFGGDTAHGVLQAIGATMVESRGELLPGIPRSSIQHGGRELALVTKAGGFGAADTLLNIRKFLENGR